MPFHVKIVFSPDNKMFLTLITTKYLQPELRMEPPPKVAALLHLMDDSSPHCCVLLPTGQTNCIIFTPQGVIGVSAPVADHLGPVGQYLAALDTPGGAVLGQ